MLASALTSGLTFEDQKNLKAVLVTHHHYDHVRDIPALAMNLYLSGGKIDIYALEPAITAVKTYFLNGDLYPRFFERPADDPVLRFHNMVPGEARQIEGYTVHPVAVNHPVPAIGYEIKSSDGKGIFYTGDTGKGLTDAWRQVSPNILIIELTAPNKYEAAVGDGSKHLTPRLLQLELESFKRTKGYIPSVVLVHMSPLEERYIKKEITAVAHSLNADIVLAKEGMKITI
jgi:ribonuclease BN (tRNA processing enzyme)